MKCLSPVFYERMRVGGVCWRGVVRGGDARLDGHVDLAAAGRHAQLGVDCVQDINGVIRLDSRLELVCIETHGEGKLAELFCFVHNGPAQKQNRIVCLLTVCDIQNHMIYKLYI